MIRPLVWALVAALCASPATAAIHGTVTAAQCTSSSCRTVVDMTVDPGTDRDQPGAVFLGVFPMLNAEPDYRLGGYYTGREWAVGGQPQPFYRGPLLRARQRVTIDGGLCPRIASAGGQPGQYAVAAGYAVATTTVGQLHAQFETMKREVATVEDTEARAQANDMLAKYEAALATLQGPGTDDTLLVANMMQSGTRWVLGTVVCP